MWNERFHNILFFNIVLRYRQHQEAMRNDSDKSRRTSTTSSLAGDQVIYLKERSINVFYVCFFVCLFFSSVIKN